MLTAQDVGTSRTRPCRTRLASVNGGLHSLVGGEAFKVGRRKLDLQLRCVGLRALHLLQTRLSVAQHNQGRHDAPAPSRHPCYPCSQRGRRRQAVEERLRVMNCARQRPNVVYQPMAKREKAARSEVRRATVRHAPFAQRTRRLCLERPACTSQGVRTLQRVSRASGHALPRDAAVFERATPARARRGCAAARRLHCVARHVRGTAPAAHTTNVDDIAGWQDVRNAVWLSRVREGG